MCKRRLIIVAYGVAVKSRGVKIQKALRAGPAHTQKENMCLGLGLGLRGRAFAWHV